MHAGYTDAAETLHSRKLCFPEGPLKHTSAYILLAMTVTWTSPAATRILNIFIEHSTSPNNIRIIFKKKGRIDIWEVSTS